jgi:hypothetical protein
MGLRAHPLRGRRRFAAGVRLTSRNINRGGNYPVLMGVGFANL